MDIFVNLLPLIVLIAGGFICILTMIVMNKCFYSEAKTQLCIVIILLALTLSGNIVAKSYQNMYYSEKDDSYYDEIENLSKNGYTVYVDGSAIDFDKIVISDYQTDKIHINYELKEIYISK